MATQRDLTFRQMVDLSFGFLGVQIAYALQSANISRIFATLGADPHQLSFFWILPPLMGMIVQPLIGKWSDRTWTRMGRRKPYLIVGAVIAVLVMLFLPNAGSLHFSTRVLLGLNMAMWFGLFSLIFLDTSINVAMQPFKMMVGDMVNEKQKTTAYSIQSFLCNAGSLLGYLFPIFFTWIGIANEAPEGVVPDSVVYSFYVGAAILILCVLYTFLRVKEMPPKEYAEFHGIDLQAQEKKSDKGLMKLLVEAPKTFWTVGLVQFFCWAAFLYMWNYTNGAIAVNCWGVDMAVEGAAASAGFQAAGNWVGVLFAIQAVGSILWATVLPRFKNV
ncbi:MAG: MFS transporter, partial [Bacteroidales bacterium]|nr:MFS transporter [Bacteroidales bacterium]